MSLFYDIDFKPLVDNCIKLMEETGQIHVGDFQDEVLKLVNEHFPQVDFAHKADQFKQMMKDQAVSAILTEINAQAEIYEYVQETDIIRKKLEKLS